MSNFTTAAMNALNSTNEADDQRAAAAHRREADVYAKLDIADAIRATAPKAAQDGPRCPHSDEQAEPGQVDGAGVAVPSGGDFPCCVPPTSQERHLLDLRVWSIEARAKKAEAQRDELEFRVQRADDLVAELRKHVDCQTRRAERVESERDEAARFWHRYRNERAAILDDLTGFATQLTREGKHAVASALRGLIERHTPKAGR